MGGQTKTGRIDILSPEQRALLQYLTRNTMGAMGNVQLGQLWQGPGTPLDTYRMVGGGGATLPPRFSIPGVARPDLRNMGTTMSNENLVQYLLRDLVTKPIAGPGPGSGESYPYGG